MKELNKQLRPHVISIVETFPFPESNIVSAIGNEYGDIYETHLKWAQESKLNTTKAGDAIPDGYLEYMMPILQAKL